MRILYWNLRGIANDPTQNALKGFVRDQCPEILCISEPFVSLDSIPCSFWRMMNLVAICTNDRGSSIPNLWVFCKPALWPLVRVLYVTDQQVTLQVMLDSVNCIITAVYARTSVVGHRKLWNDLVEVKGRFVSGPWLVFGDFNAVLGAHEGGAGICRLSCEEFQAMSDICELVHVNTKGAEFTWVRRRGLRGNVESRLDRSLANLEWLDIWERFDCCTLTRTCSDHHPLLMSFSKSSGARHSLFRFQKMWLQHADFHGFVKQSWNSVDSFGCPLSVLQQKLRSLRKALQNWNWEVFGDIHRRVDTDMAALDFLQQDIAHNGGSDEAFVKEAELQANLNESLRLQEMFWREKARVQWLSEGDRNTKFFHAMCRARRLRSSISFLRDGDQVYEDPFSINNHIVDFYSSLFARVADYHDASLVNQVIPSLVSEEDNYALIAPPSAEEIFMAIKSMDSDSSPGPDGFNGHFFIACWDIVGQDVVRAVQKFFSSSHLPASFNSGLIILIPKVENADAITQYRPIALSNFVFKIIPKIMALRLAPIAARIISP
ncbi:hypothetical protein M0R45_000540 [Rubus argutus]|uniref:Endonuclease/exonuclease/phosphatase domain-containing protein n=1 Tax=Rubus argutus TaxID=59490 RepID=A0AAW1VLL7_RUBAR